MDQVSERKEENALNSQISSLDHAHEDIVEMINHDTGLTSSLEEVCYMNIILKLIVLFLLYCIGLYDELFFNS